METKFCPRCHVVKPVGDFYKSRAQSSGYAVYYIQCEREKDREYRKTEKGKARAVRMHQQRKAKNAMRYRARHRVSHAIQKGILKPAKEYRCFICGGEAEQYHHHKGYDQAHWLDVIPVCAQCHKQAHHQ